MVRNPVLSAFEKFAGRTLCADADSGREYTYEAIHRLACGFERILDAQGLRRGDRIAILSENSPLYVALYLACLRGGQIAVPVNTALSKADIEYIIAASGARTVACSDEGAALVPPNAVERRHLETLRIDAYLDESRLAGAYGGAADGGAPLQGLFRADDSQLWVLMFTSGTTGKPKGIAHTLGSLSRAAVAFAECYGFDTETRLLHVSNMAYMAGFLNTLLGPLVAGGSIVLAQPFGARTALEFWDTPIKYQVNTFWLVPSILTALLRLDRTPNGPSYCRHRVRAVCVGTAPLPRPVQLEFQTRYGVEAFESYGLSETLFVAGNSPAFPRKPGSVGRLFPLVSVQTLDDAGQMTDGRPGEIHVRTAYQMAGYWDEETQAPNTLPPSAWFPTGDVGFVDSDGDVFITGRKKDIIIRGGINVSPRAIEDAILGYPGVQDAAVVGIPHDFYGEDVVAFLELRQGMEAASVLSGLPSFCRTSLAAASVPSRFVVLDALPRNNTGKVLKGVLRKQAART